jgi:hypothetical protein
MSIENVLLKYITPDEQMTWDTKQIADEIPGFEFKGPGWYFKENSSMLIISTSTQDVYTIQVFFDRDPRPGYGAVMEAPVRATDGTSMITEQRKINYGGLMVLLVGMLIFMPLSAFILAKFHMWGVVMMLAFAVVWGIVARRTGKPQKSK